MNTNQSNRNKQPWVGIQMGAHTMYDEGIEHALDLLRDTARVNALVVSAFGGGWRNGKGWPVVKRADHGAPIPDPPRHSPAAWVQTHPEHYRGMRHRWPEEPGCDYGDCDILEDCAEPAAKRGIALYPRLFECRAEIACPADWGEVDALGRATGRKCVNNPDFNAFSQATVEDLAVHHPQIQGIMYLQERHGPLTRIFGPTLTPDLIGHCFCEHCRRDARTEGLDPNRAIAGYQELTDLALEAGRGESRPADGWFITFNRLFLKYPEIYGWEAFWWERLHRHRQGLYRAIKSVNSDLRVGYHVHNPISFHLFYRMGMNFQRISRYSDWVKPNVYPYASGGRSRNAWRNGLMRTLLKDLRPEIAIGFLYDILGFNPEHMPSVEAYLSEEEMPGWNEHYVAVETRRAVEGFGKDVAVYPGLGFDMPGCKDTPESVEAGMRAVFQAGAPGVLLSREYEEMKVEHLQAAGKVIDELSR